MQDPNCIFCKIAAKEVSSEIVFENDNFFAFLDINPRSPGHTLIIPRNHHRWLWDVPETAEYFETAKVIALAQRKAYDTESVWVNIQGDEVAHAHISLFPNPNTTQGDKIDFKENAEKIRKYL